MNTASVAQSRIGIMLPVELIEYIWKINYSWAANIIRKYTQQFIEGKVISIKQMTNFAYFKCNFGLGIGTYHLFYRNRILNNNNVLQTMNACKCCVRHQVNKPKILQKWTETDFHGTQTILCACPCRSLARWVCREVD